MDGDISVVYPHYMFLQVADQVVHLLGRGVAYGIRNIQCSGSGGHGYGVALGQKFPVGAGGVLGGELDIVAVALGIAHHFVDIGDHLLTGHFQLVLHVDVAGGQKYVDAGVLGALHCVPGGVDVPLGGTGQAGHGAVIDSLRDGLYAAEIFRRGDGKAGLDDIHAKGVQLPGHVQLFGQVHAAAGGLLAVAECCVENFDFFHVKYLLDCERYRCTDKTKRPSSLYFKRRKS